MLTRHHRARPNATRLPPLLAGYHPYQVRREIVMMRGCLCTNIVTYLDAFIKPHDGLAKLWANP